jgi:hypothetical protein
MGSNNKTHCNNPATIALWGEGLPVSCFDSNGATHPEMSFTRAVKLAGKTAGMHDTYADTEKYAYRR